jgi:ferredoxin
MRIVANYDRCAGNAVCVGIAPDLFALGDNDLVKLLQEEPDESRREDAQAAGYICPTLALRIED